eukprot:1146394-Pelagomonas_calceolata.AAC.1
MINTIPKQAHREIFRDKNAQPRAGLQALRDPGTNTIETEPARQAQIIEKYYIEAMNAVNIKKGKCLPEEAPRNYPGNRLEKQNLYRIPSGSNFK